MRSRAVTASKALLATMTICWLSTGVWCPSVLGQARVQFPSPMQTAPPLVPVSPQYGPTGTMPPTGFSVPGNFPQPGFSQPRFPQPGFPAPGSFPQPSAALGGTIQPFDPYSLPSNAPNVPPNFGLPPVTAPGYPGSIPTGPFSSGVPQMTPPPSSIWQGQTPSLSVGPLPNVPPNGAITGPMPPPIGSPYGAPNGNQDPYFRNSPFPNGTPPLNRGGYGYGNDLGYQNNAPGYGQGIQPQRSAFPYARLFQDTGLRGTYLHGTEKDDLAMTEAEASTTAYFANFLGVPNGLRVTPGFAFHWTDGPQAPETTDVPARLYSGYLDFGLEPQLTPNFGAELSARVGIYSDFQSFNSDSIRLLGTAVGVYQASPEVAIKFGAAYIDRVKYKLLPAAGILWTPNPQTRWDIFFPAPKLSNYWTTINGKQFWWYLGGEYGGGSWSIEREEDPRKGINERIDINDVRIYAGIETWNLNRYYGFAEIGYVFDREVVFYRVPGDSIHVDDTFMARAGFSW